MRKALKATCLSFQIPRHISVVPPEATAISPRFSSPRRDPTEVGSSPVSLEISPSVATNFVSCTRSAGAACSW